MRNFIYHWKQWSLFCGHPELEISVDFKVVKNQLKFTALYLLPFWNWSIVHIIGKLLWIGNGIGLGHLLSGSHKWNRGRGRSWSSLWCMEVVTFLDHTSSRMGKVSMATPIAPCSQTECSLTWWLSWGMLHSLPPLGSRWILQVKSNN